MALSWAATVRVRRVPHGIEFDQTASSFMQSNLFAWELHLQALGPTIVAVVVGCVASGIAWRQWRTANYRLRFDLYEKRSAVYEAIRYLIGQVQLHGQITAEELGEFYTGIRGAEFLFDGDTRDFIRRIRDTAFKARMATLARQRAVETVAEDLVDREEDLLAVLRNVEQQLEKVFSRYLDLSKVGL